MATSMLGLRLMPGGPQASFLRGEARILPPIAQSRRTQCRSGVLSQLLISLGMFLGLDYFPRRTELDMDMKMFAEAGGKVSLKALDFLYRDGSEECFCMFRDVSSHLGHKVLFAQIEPV
jgi:hypothetical protein